MLYNLNIILYFIFVFIKARHNILLDFTIGLFFIVDCAKYNEALEKRFSDIRTRLHHAESLNRQRENDLFILRNHFIDLVSIIYSNGSVLPNRYGFKTMFSFHTVISLMNH